MNKPSYIKILGKINIDPYINFLNKNDINWNHSFNKLYNRDKDFKNVLAFPIVDQFKKLNFYSHFLEIGDEAQNLLFKNYGKGIFFKIHFSRMNSSSKIRKHTDNGLGFALSHRVHIPLITHDKVVVEVGNKKFIPLTGQMFEINNLKPHTVKVGGKKERLNLIIDYMKEDIYESFF